MRHSSKFESGDDGGNSPDGTNTLAIAAQEKFSNQNSLLPTEITYSVINEERKSIINKKLENTQNLTDEKISSEPEKKHDELTLPTPDQIDDEKKKNVVMNLAATRIQTCFRGWLVRTNLKIVTKCTIKIQALWRGSLVRMHWKSRIDDACQKKKREKIEAEEKLKEKSQSAAIAYESLFAHEANKIKAEEVKGKQKSQSLAPVSGIIGERIKKYLDITDERIRNESIDSEIEGTEDEVINDIEESESMSVSVDSLASSFTEEEAELRMRMEKALQCLEAILKNFCQEDLERISKTHVVELVTYLDSNPTATKSDVCVANSLARMFPPISADEENSDNQSIKPEVKNTRLLKDGIRLLRQKIKAWETQKLYKFHHLARTATIPGVYSDPFSSGGPRALTTRRVHYSGSSLLAVWIIRETEKASNQIKHPYGKCELTEIEDKLNGLKFFDSKDANSYVSPAKLKTETQKQLKELAHCDPDEVNTLQKIYNFKMNYFPTGTEKNEDGINDITFPRIKTPPPFTTLFKSKSRPRS